MKEIQLPTGYTCRPTQLEDVEATVEMFNAWSQKHLGVNELTVEIMKREWTMPGYDVSQSSRVVIDPQGKLVAYYEMWDNGYPHVVLSTWGRIHPEHEGKGLGTYLLNWAERRAWEIVPQAPAEARVVLRSWLLSHLQDAGNLFRAAGHDLIRYNLRMLIELNGQPPAPVIPAGITIRPMRVGQDERATFETLHDSFHDHWGYVERPLEEAYERFLHDMHNNETFDPNLWYLAWEGDGEDARVVGTSLCLHHITEDPSLGWVGSLGVLRDWRRRGLGEALLLHSFAGLYAQGQRKVGLGVDAESLTGATRLYEKAGMRSEPERTYAIYEKELRAGVDLSTTSA